jgi:hypothetical protein
VWAIVAAISIDATVVFLLFAAFVAIAQRYDAVTACPFRKSYPDVLVMQPSQDRNSDNGATSLNCTVQRRILL